jgi:histidine triad (HIT) family protein
MKECLFCKIAEGLIKSKVVYEDEEIIAIEDINPQAPVHVLMMPKRHIPTALEVEEEDAKVVGRIFVVAKNLAEKLGVSEKGFRIVLNCKDHGGQAVYHLHFHLLGGRQMGWPPG